jgi:DNA-binding GntR family transcriptional regulator
VAKPLDILIKAFIVNELIRSPLYQQLHQSLRQLINQDQFQVGDQFFTERQVCERYDVSRTTANKALSTLVAEGLLEFKKGIGTFVKSGVLDYDLQALVSFTDKACNAGMKPSTKVLTFKKVKAGSVDDDVSTSLRPQDDDVLYYIERLRMADRHPVILEKRFISAKHCQGCTKSNFKGSLYALWTKTYNLKITSADQTIRAITINGADAKLLETAKNAAAFLVQSTGFLDDGSPLWFERTLYRGDAYEFHNRLGGIKAARPAAGMLVDMIEQCRNKTEVRVNV